MKVIRTNNYEETSKIAAFQEALFETMDARYFETLEAIRITGKLNQSTEQHLKDAITDVLQQFNAAL